MSHLNRESVSSIQLALDLEHQLDDGEHHHLTSPNQKGSNGNMSAADSLSTEYDSEVLTSIIIQLRANLAQLTQERDESNQALAESGHKYAALEAKAADLQELLDAERNRAEKAEAERDEAQKSAQENEEQVNLLRAKVEESRRGVMRLQAESRRMSTQTLKTGPLPLDLSAAAGGRSPGLVSGFSNTAKRASFQLSPPSAFGSQNQPSSRPMGMGHRRISSLSDPGPNVAPPTPNRSSTLLSDPVNIIDGLPPSPVTHTFEDVKNGDGTTIKTKRLSLVARRDHSPPGLPPASVLTAELDSVRGELTSTKKELESAKHELAEAIDKREASDACIKALREFIAEQAIGESTAVAPSSSSIKDDASSVNSIRSPTVSFKGLRLPPLPTEDNIPEDAASSTGPKKGGWGLRLWSTPATTPGSEASWAPAATPQIPATSSSSTAATPASTPLTSFVSSWTRSVSGGTQAPATSSGQAATTPAQPEASASAPTTGLRKFSLFGKPLATAPGAPATNAKDPQTASVHSTAPSISSSRTPDLVHSVSTSPQTDTTSLRSGALSEEEEHGAAAAKLVGIEGTTVFLDPAPTEKNLGDVTPTLSSSAVSLISENARMESVAL